MENINALIVLGVILIAIAITIIVTSRREMRKLDHLLDCWGNDE